MKHITAGRTGVSGLVFDLADQPHHVTVQSEAVVRIDAYDIDADLSDLAGALHDALTAQHAGTLGGPGVDDVALSRAARRARRADASTLLRTQVAQLRQFGRAAA